MSEQMTVFLHTGTNLGNRKRNLSWAKLMINEQLGAILQQSAVYETAAWGVENQPAFLNQALAISTTLEPEQLLEKIHRIENKLGRKRLHRWAERIIDIDILFYDDQVINSPWLTVPHPRMQTRNFVLQPLLEIAPNMMHPVLNKTITELAKACDDGLSVRRMHP